MTTVLRIFGPPALFTVTIFPTPTTVPTTSKEKEKKILINCKDECNLK